MTVDAGRMTTRSSYTIRWLPRKVGRYVLRVRKPGDALRAAGVTQPWRHRVRVETAADIATDILQDRGITLATVHVGGGSDGATPKANMVDVANGRRARHSCYGTAPCGSTRMDLRVLRAAREMGRRGTLSVSEFAGGSHAGSSAHYTGRAIDINWVNGYGGGYDMAVDVCRAYGAKEIFSPHSDPWGGHSTHVHCGW